MARLQVGSWYRYKPGEDAPKNLVFCIIAFRRIRGIYPQIGWISVSKSGKINKDKWGDLSGGIDESKIEKLKTVSFAPSVSHKLFKVIFERP